MMSILVLLRILRWWWWGLNVNSGGCTLLLVLSNSGGADAIVPLTDFYPFGTEHGDSTTPKQDDGGSGPLEISVKFPFFGDRHSSLYVNNNGILSFLREVSQFTPVAFPIANDRRVVAAFWADVDNRRAGEVYYRESKDPIILQRATEDIHSYFKEFSTFIAHWVFIATWYRVTFFGGSSFSPVNTFQTVMIADEEFAFTIFNYETITWTTGMHASSGGDFAGLGGIAAQAGFNAGDGKRYFNIPGSRTDDIVDVEETTNVGIPGRWVFRIDDAHVQVGSCNDTLSVCANLRPCLNGGQCIDDCVTGNPSYTCSCLAGYTGRRCHIDVNECASYPCQNGGSCIDGRNSFTCLCAPGFTNITCETDVNECASNPCQNRGICVDGRNNFICQCPSGFTGLLCETDIDDCANNPCKNGGTCDDGIDAYFCMCTDGYTGQHCEVELNECDTSPCLNGGHCVDLINNYTCVCSEDFTGLHCETAMLTDPCLSSPCQNGGTCQDTEEGYICDCPEQYTGRECETELSESCLCHNGGFCTEGNNTCDCLPGFFGEHCELEITTLPCSSNQACPNGGPCMEHDGMYLCMCLKEDLIMGSINDSFPSLCDPDPCVNGGSCVEQDDIYICECPTGFYGKYCEKVRLRPCMSSPCRNGGSCKEIDGGYQCLCPFRFTGKHCEIGKPDPCSSSPCRNGGTCFHYIGKYKCECPADYTGRHCELAASPCLSSPCKNGGTCAEEHGGYVCTCLASFTGKHCEEDIHCGDPEDLKHAQVFYHSTRLGATAVYVCNPGYYLDPEKGQRICQSNGQWSDPPVCEENDECLSEPCLNGGNCHDRVASFVCTCESGYIGPYCEIELNECLSDPCKNGGTCEDSPGAYTCLCPVAFTGLQCETEFDICELEPCQNEGECQSYEDSYLCLCPEGFIGYNCESVIDPCFLNPCGMRGYCRSENGSYSCTCKMGYTGINCEKELLPPVSLTAEQVDTTEMKISWLLPKEQDGEQLINGFAVTYVSTDGNFPKTDFVEKGHSSHILRSLAAGRAYNISVYSVKRNVYNRNDISHPSILLLRTRPPPVENLHVLNVTSSSIAVKWALHKLKHSTVSKVRASINSTHLLENISVYLDPNTTKHTFHDLLPGQRYFISIVTRSGTLVDEHASESLPSGPLPVWTRPLPPQNFNITTVTSTTAQVSWKPTSFGITNGYILNITNNQNTKSRYIPDGSLHSYTIQDLVSGQKYLLSLSTVLSTEYGQVPSSPVHLFITTASNRNKSQEKIGNRNGSNKFSSNHISSPMLQEPRLGSEQESSEDPFQPPRYTELVDGRGRISARFGSSTNKAITHKTQPETEAPVKLENLEESTNKISMALEIKESKSTSKTDDQTNCSLNPCRNGGTCVNEADSYICDCRTGFKGRNCELYCKKLPQPCTRLYSETKTIPVWKGVANNYLYRTTYKVFHDVCYKEICEPHIPKIKRRKPHSKISGGL
ncbi:sushi, nidogen and EGF-like domain-containing protein 1 [Protopterus annectens]|uniref:sushi, nidogen and EGF-like domain-containing protein 1 n=1 Tax=Protopterus annectens TaxID=7888 RepID=UPI001CFAD6CA|nr:sushi, nidogen and EGF-like domain-containing protein 1 [Protopterus annectens]